MRKTEKASLKPLNLPDRTVPFFHNNGLGQRESAIYCYTPLLVKVVSLQNGTERNVTLHHVVRLQTPWPAPHGSRPLLRTVRSLPRAACRDSPPQRASDSDAPMRSTKVQPSWFQSKPFPMGGWIPPANLGVQSLAASRFPGP